jgi:hypothetical protein
MAASPQRSAQPVARRPTAGDSVDRREFVPDESVVGHVHSELVLDERKHLRESSRVDVAAVEEIDVPAEEWVA